MKVEKVISRANPLGGIHFIAHLFRQLNLKEFISDHFDDRVSQAQYSHEDVVLTTILLALCNGSYIEDVQSLKTIIEDCNLVKVPSSDTIARILKSLAGESHNLLTKSSKKPYELNRNDRLLTLNIQLLKKLGMMHKNNNVLDFDVSIIANYKCDRKPTYNKKLGYAPMFGFINNKYAIYCGGRSGNTAPSSHQVDPVKYTITQMKKQNCNVSKFRADAAAYSSNLINYLSEEGIKFYIRAQPGGDVIDNINFDIGWTECDLNFRSIGMAEIKHTPYRCNKEHRLIVTRGLVRENSKASKRGKYIYRAIITNDHDIDMLEVVKFYDQRGGVERNFELLNQLNMSRLPFSFLRENVVYMTLTMITMNLFRHITSEFGKKVSFVNKNMFLKSFVTNFMLLVTRWQREKYRETLIIESDKNYEVLLE